METKKQTAVEWLVEQLEKHHVKIDIKNTVVFEQAKALEKQQIEMSYKVGYNDCSLGRFSDCEKYYTSTYGQ